MSGFIFRHNKIFSWILFLKLGQKNINRNVSKSQTKSSIVTFMIPIGNVNDIYDKYTIQSVVCEASCHPVIQSLGHSVTRSLVHLVTRILSSCHPVILSSCLPVIMSSFYPVISVLNSTCTLTDGHTTLGPTGLLRRQ